ncbi:auxin-responsive protein SAUR72-like [Rosa rugosa]|uniref:auxin-responsive protein SAUR72-like n=1 Tax=Rosa rugosa TaxID=74645 RepID=UPI002B409CC9|nr:auxin-responsive protein SAUR72-like [Rosa rugosa]
MKQLIRRLSRVADSSQYCLLRSSDSTAASGASSNSRPRRSESFRVLKLRRRRSNPETGVPEGHVPVYVGDEMERFVVSAELLNHPVFVELLNKSAQEYGYEQRGVLRIPCHVVVFERVLETLRLGRAAPSSDINDLLGSLSEDRHFIYAN